MNIIISGLSGFVGSALLGPLVLHNIKALGRTKLSSYHGDFHFAEINGSADYADFLKNNDVLIHCAARVHIMDESSLDPLTEFREINVSGTLNLARQAASAGIKRFIFISSIKVNGEGTQPGAQFTPSDIPAPEDPYGVSKYEAEQGLQQIAKNTGMEVVIIRPPLVYGAGVKGNFNSLLKLAKTGLPLPFGAIHNKRSMVYLGNLIAFIVECIDHPKAANEVFLISDGNDLSINRLITELRLAMFKPVRLLPMPGWLFTFVGKVTGNSSVVSRLCGSLQVDSSKVNKLLGWVPPYSVQQGLQLTVNNFLKDN